MPRSGKVPRSGIVRTALAVTPCLPSPTPCDPISNRHSTFPHRSIAGGGGLYYYGARFYDSYLNRWTQPDTIGPDPYNPLDWDRYSYSRNNPVRYSDLTGHVVCDGLGYNGACEQTVPVTLVQVRVELRSYGVSLVSYGTAVWTFDELDI